MRSVKSQLASSLRTWWGRLAAAAPVAAIVVWLVTVIPPVKEWLSEPKLVLQGIDVYTVEVAPEVYQLGLVARVANLDNSAHQLAELSFEGASLDIAARGSAYIREIHRPVAVASVMDSNLLRPSDVAVVKLLLPLRIHMTMKYPPPPEFVLWGRWVFRVKRGPLSREQTKTAPEFIGHSESVLSLDEWNTTTEPALGKGIKRKLFPRNFVRSNSYRTFLLFNPDSSASLDIYGFDQTNAAQSGSGVMVFVVGTGEPPLPLGWTILGSNYPEVWSNPKALAIYNSVYPPGHNGAPRPFGVFAGREREMGVTESVPTTRGRDIINVRLLNPSEFDSSNPVYFRFTATGITQDREQRP